MFDICIAMPSVGIPEIIVPTIYSIAEHIDPSLKTCISVSMSKTDKSDPQEIYRQLAPLEGKFSIEIEFYEDEGGFAKNSNRALNKHIQLHGKPKYVLFLNSDVRPTKGWLQKMVAAFSTDKVQSSTGNPAPYDASLYGRIGIVGPRSNFVAGHQLVQMPAAEVMPADAPDCDIVGHFGAELESAMKGVVCTTEFISGFAMMASWECVEDISYMDMDANYHFFDEGYGRGGYEDNDVCVRANLGGWRKAIAADTFVYHVGSQTTDMIYSDHKRGMVNCVEYIEKWSEYTQRDQKLVGCYRVALRSPEELKSFRYSMKYNSRFLDGIAVLVSKDTSLFTHFPEWNRGYQLLDPEDKEFVSEALQGKPISMEKWEAFVRSCLPEGFPVSVAKYEGLINEAKERNAAIQNAHKLEPDWIISIDADEIVEDRVNREHMERLMKNPDPLVMSYDFAWVNFWESQSLYRVDGPWGDGGAYTHSMRGRRMWRVCGGQRHIPVYGGLDLHCGNSPDFCWMSTAFTNIRFKHYGYLSAPLRHLKHRYITSLDKHPDEQKVGSNSYSHLISSDGIKLDTYTPYNGIALSMLWHSGECFTDMYRHMSKLYGMIDEAVFVWTDVCPIPEPFLKISKAYGAEWKHCSLLDRLDECRNEAIKFLNSSERLEKKVSWCLVIDPDEAFAEDSKALIAIRRMAESQDTLGWSFEFRNIYRKEIVDKASTSSSCRMFRLHTPLPIEFKGAVHETIDHSLRALSKAGLHPRVKKAKFVMVNDNRNLTVDQFTSKLQKYAELAVRGIEEDPDNARLWLVLSNTYQSMGEEKKQVDCLSRAISLNEKSYLARKELALVRIKQAVEQLRVVEKLVVKGSSYYVQVAEMLEYLDSPSFMPPVMNHGKLVFDDPKVVNHGYEQNRDKVEEETS